MLLAGLAVMIAMAPADAQDLTGDVDGGRELARSVCANCHAVEPGEIKSPRLEAPPFPEVAASPQTTPLGLRVFLRTPHKKMPNFVLSETETDDIIAYILSLK